MTHNLKNIFSRIVLKESSAYKNVIAINEQDVKFLKTIGIYALENFRSDISDVLKEAETNSFLFQQLKNESIRQLKGTQSVYWNQQDYQSGKDPVGYHLVSIDKNQFTESKGKVLTKYFQENYLSLYLPIVEDWCRYYIKTCNEGIGRKIILSSVAHALEPHKMKKLCLYKGSKEELVDLVR